MGNKEGPSLEWPVPGLAPNMTLSWPVKSVHFIRALMCRHREQPKPGIQDQRFRLQDVKFE